MLARRMADVSVRARIQRAIEDWLPWYDPKAERERVRHIDELAEREQNVRRMNALYQSRLVGRR